MFPGHVEPVWVGLEQFVSNIAAQKGPDIDRLFNVSSQRKNQHEACQMPRPYTKPSFRRQEFLFRRPRSKVIGSFSKKQPS
jgi:hypothetical protein